MEPHDYRTYYVNNDLRHQYGISAAEVLPRETSLSGDERGKTFAVRRLLLSPAQTKRST